VTARDTLRVPCRPARGPCSGRNRFVFDAVHSIRWARGNECDDQSYRTRLGTDGRGSCWGVTVSRLRAVFGLYVPVPDSGTADLVTSSVLATAN
jgi:hypothetical protein